MCEGSKRLEGVKGWLLVYMLGSIPVVAFYSMGLSGWFFEYPFPLMLAIFLILAVPLLLLLVRSAKAPQWNIAALWIAAVLMTLRVVSVSLLPVAAERQPLLSSVELLGIAATLCSIVVFSLVWAIAWTRYFKSSVRVRTTFGK